jgi:dipeptidase
MKLRLIAAILPTALACSFQSDACTNLIAGKGATTDGSVMVTYAADSHNLYGELYHHAAAHHKSGEMRPVYDWDTSKYLGQIAEASETYNVVGNMNEHQVVIAESTWGGRQELEDTTGNSVVDYGSLIYIALQRSKSARQAIDVMTSLVEEYGYASSGESFSIADKNEVWVMEMIGKGAEKGAVWVAVRIPDNAISGHANEPRIRKVDFSDKNNVLHSKDVISFARKRGYFSGKDEDFSFADAYGEHDVATRRGCDARVWSYFRRFSADADKYYDWCSGKSDEPMPLYIIPDKKVSLKEMQERMRDHFEDTPFDMHADIGAGANHVPYRWRPMEYEVDGKKYCNERAISTQQTGWSFISQSRSEMPDAVGGVLWFGTDDTNTCVYMPFYCSMTVIPYEIRVGTGDMNTFSFDSNFWMNNWVANQAYNRYDLMIPDIRKVQSALEDEFQSSRKAQEDKLTALYNSGDIAQLRSEVNAEGAAIAKKSTTAYKELAQYLIVRFMDGNMKKVDANGKFIYDENGHAIYPEFPGYNKEYYENIVRSTGDHFLIP